MYPFSQKVSVFQKEKSQLESDLVKIVANFMIFINIDMIKPRSEQEYPFLSAHKINLEYLLLFLQRFFSRKVSFLTFSHDAQSKIGQ